MSNCDYWRQQLSFRLDGMAESTVESALTSHLAECAECRKFAAFLDKLEHSPAPAMATPDFWPMLQARLKTKSLARWWPALRTAAVFILALGVFAYLAMQGTHARRDIAELRKQNLVLQSRIGLLEKEAASEEAIVRRAFACYDSQQWTEARACLERLSTSPREENQALSLYYRALIACQQGDTPLAVDLIARLVNHPRSSLYLASVQFLLESLAKSTIRTESEELKKQIKQLWLDTDQTLVNLPKHTMLSY